MLFSTFFKIGFFTFGGGYAMIPLIQREIVENRKLIKSEDIIDIFAVSQSLPGAIAINSATFIGRKIAGIPGAVAATIGVVLPSIIVITVVAMFFLMVKDNPIIAKVFGGIRAAIVALIIIAVANIAKTSIKDYINIAMATAAFLVTSIFDVHSIYAILGGLILGIILGGIVDKNKAAKEVPFSDIE